MFGASGKVGSLTVSRLLDNGHTVVVFVHASSPFTESKQLRIVRGDVHDARAVEQAVAGSQAVISTLGSWGQSQKDVLSAAMRFAIPALEAGSNKRIITLTGSAASTPNETLPVAARVFNRLFGMVARDIQRDGEEHLRLLAASNLDWTTLRAGIVKDGAADHYILNQAVPKAWERINRQAVARALVEQLESSNFSRSAPHIHP